MVKNVRIMGKGIEQKNIQVTIGYLTTQPLYKTIFNSTQFISNNIDQEKLLQ